MVQGLSRQSENHSPAAHLSDCPCSNHPEKQATHTLNSSQTREVLHYCEKCAIMLASQGFNVLRLPRKTKDHLSGRQKEILTFLGELSSYIERLQSRGSVAERFLRQSQANFNHILGEASHFFQEMEQLLQVQKYLSYNAILSKRGAAQNDLRALRQATYNEVQDLSSIVRDIKNNTQAVEAVEQPIYRSIMDNYRRKVIQASQLSRIDIQPLCYPSLVLPEIPRVLYSLADRLILRPHSEPALDCSIPAYQGSHRAHVPASSQDRLGRPRTIIPQFLSLTSMVEAEGQEGAFSFDSHRRNTEQNDQECLFHDRLDRIHPQELPLRESLNLTEIKEDDFECRYGEGMGESGAYGLMTSGESLGGLFRRDPRICWGQAEGDTETLLIC